MVAPNLPGTIEDLKPPAQALRQIRRNPHTPQPVVSSWAMCKARTGARPFGTGNLSLNDSKDAHKKSQHNA